MKSAYRSVMFYIGQKELEMQFKMNRIVAQCRQKCEMMQEKFTEKLEQVHTAYQKMSKRCQMMQQEIESLTKDNQELQEKFAEKSRSVSITFPACTNQILSFNAKLFQFQAEEKIG